MSDFLVCVLSRSGERLIVDPDDFTQEGNLSPLMQIAVAILRAGYGGIAVDAAELRNGRVICSVDADLATPEGRLIQELSSIEKSGWKLPAAKTVLARLALIYRHTTNAGDEA